MDGTDTSFDRLHRQGVVDSPKRGFALRSDARSNQSAGAVI